MPPNQNPSQSAFEQLVLPHADAAYTLARHLLRDQATAADILQESLLRAWRYFASFKGHTTAEALPWLLQIVRHNAWSHLDRNRTQNLPEDLPLVDESTPDPADLLTRQLDAETLRSAVDALPAIYREVIVLRELDQLSYKEICTVTGTTMGTIMSRLSRARRQLLASLSIRIPKESRHDL